MKTTIIADSHKLSAFERCPRSCYYSYYKHIEQPKPRDAFSKGTLMHDLLYWFYKFKIENRPFESCTKNAIEHAMSRPVISCWFLVSDIDRLLILRKFAEYCNYYRKEAIQPVGVEVGFSKTFYEDDSVHFIYEGKIDFIAEVERNRLAWVDHKTQAFKYDIIGERNQFMGYSWALKYNTGMINFIGLQDSYKPDQAFRRQIVTYKVSLLAEWYETMKRLFFRMALAHEEMAHFDKHRTACEGKFGLCEFHRVCSETSPNIIDGIITNEYKARPQWIPWE